MTTAQGIGVIQPDLRPRLRLGAQHPGLWIRRLVVTWHPYDQE